MNGSFFKESCGRLRLSGNGCGQCKRFTAHCGEANTMVAFLSLVTFPVTEGDFLASKSDRKSAPKMSARLQILQMESFALFLPTLPSSWTEGRCSGSENRRKCDGVLASCWQFATFEGQLGRNPHCWLGAKISLNVE